MNQHLPPWWFRLAQKWFPERTREIPEAVNPDRIVIRQFAIWKRHVYLQQFASSEDSRWMHSHQWERTIAIGLWGRYIERRMDGKRRGRIAPYCYTMGSDVIHHVQVPSPGHTAIFIGLWRDDDLKKYHSYPGGKAWEQHVKVQVKRI